MPVKAVFFDLDGTLVDTAPDFVVTANQLIVENQLPAIDENTIRNTVSDGSRALVKLIFDMDEHHADFESHRQRLLTIYGNHMGNHCQLFPSIGKLLKKLKQQKLPWGIITNKPLRFAEPLIEMLNLRDEAKLLLCPDHVSRPKPDPESIYLACRHIGCNVDEIMYIGDHYRDIVCGNSAGSTTVAVAYGYIKPDDNIQQWQADYIADTVDDIWPIIQKIEEQHGQ